MHAQVHLLARTYIHRETSICIKFTSSVEGVSGEFLSSSELQELIKSESANWHQVVGVQMIVGAKCGYRKKPSRKSIVYKTEFLRESSLGHSFRHTKEYDVQFLGKKRAGDMNSPSLNFPALPLVQTHEKDKDVHSDGAVGRGDYENANILSTSMALSKLMTVPVIGEEEVRVEVLADMGQEDGMPRGWVAPWRAKRQVVQSQALNRSLLSEITLRCVKYVEKSRGITLQSLRGHFVEDSSNRVWMVGVSKLMPFESDNEYVHVENDSASATQAEMAAERLTKSIYRMQEAAKACLEAVKTPAARRREKAHQVDVFMMRNKHNFHASWHDIRGNSCHTRSYAPPFPKHTRILSLSLSLPRSHSLSLSQTQTHIHTHTHIHAYTHTHTHTHTQPHTHTHTHIFSLSLPRSPFLDSHFHNTSCALQD